MIVLSLKSVWVLVGLNWRRVNHYPQTAKLLRKRVCSFELLRQIALSVERILIEDVICVDYLAKGFDSDMFFISFLDGREQPLHRDSHGFI